MAALQTLAATREVFEAASYSKFQSFISFDKLDNNCAPFSVIN